MLTPNDVPDGAFVIRVDPPEDLQGRSWEDWFQRRVDADVARRGGSGNRGRVSRNGDRMMVVEVSYRNLSVVHSAVRRADGAVQFARIQTSLSAANAQHHITESGQMLAQLLTANSARSEAKARAVVPPAPEEKRTPEGAPPEGAVPAGAGVRPEAIEALMHEGEGTTTVWGFAYVETVHLLLKDGWEYRGLDKPPSDLDVNASRQMEPQKWHHWRKAGSDYEVQDNGAWHKLKADVVRPLEPGSGLNARLEYGRAYSSGGMGGSVFTRSFSFSPDGRFERGNSALHGTGSVQATQGFSGSAASTSNRQGRSTAGGFASGTAVSGRFSSKSTAGAADMTGTYRIVGYTLELHCDSGKVEHLLVFYPDPKDTKGVYVTDATFLPPRH